MRETVPQVADQVEQIVQTILRTGEPITGIEVNGQRPDNAQRCWVTYWHPLKSFNGDIVGINVAAEEITERKRVQEALAANEQRLRELAETLAQRVAAQARERDRIWNVSQDLLVVADTEGRIVRVNPAWTAMLGWSETDSIGMSAESLVHPDDRERSSAELAGLIQGRKTTHFENRLRHRAGSYRWVSWQAVSDQDLLFAVGRDITDLKEAEEQLRASRRELAEVTRHTAMGAMTASIAHEISQPLAAIVVNANAGLRWLDRPQPDLDEVRGILGRIVSEGHRTSEVIATVRGMFGRKPTEKSLLNVNRLIGDVLALVQGELEIHQVSLENKMEDGLPEVAAERVQLQQVLLNLIMNAVDAMGSIPRRERRLTIRSEKTERGGVKIAVGDSGIGIDPIHKARIFEPFFTTKPNGMGMGLSICRSIIESHGGRLSAEPRSSRGAEFCIELPTTAPAAEATADA